MRMTDTPMNQAYDSDNVFARIIRGEIPCAKICETEHILAFRDINPQATEHILIIPKGAYVSFADFTANASDGEIIEFIRTAGKIAKDAGLDETGYRLLSNHGEDANQEVPHFHLHIVGGNPLGPMLKRG